MEKVNTALTFIKVAKNHASSAHMGSSYDAVIHIASSIENICMGLEELILASTENTNQKKAEI